MSFWILALYYLVLATLAAYGLHRLLLVREYRRRPAAAPGAPPVAAPLPQGGWGVAAGDGPAADLQRKVRGRRG